MNKVGDSELNSGSNMLETIKMNSTSMPMNVSDDYSDNATSIQTQKPLEGRLYSGAITSSVQILTNFIGAVGITGNLLALIVFLGHKPLLRRPANYFLVSQCTINLLVSIMLILLIEINGSHWSPSMVVPMCYLWNSRVIFSALLESSFYNISLLTVERYLEIVHPIMHHRKISKGKVIASIVAGILISVIYRVCLVFPSVKITKGICSVGSYPTAAAARLAAVSNFLFEYFIPIIVFVFCYASMARSLRRLSKVTQPASEITAQRIDPKISRARRNIIKTLLIVVLGFIICTSFMQFLVLSSFLGDVALDLGGVIYNVSLVMSYMTCCCDPFVYGLCYEEFRVGIRKLLCRSRVMPSGSGRPTTNTESLNK